MPAGKVGDVVVRFHDAVPPRRSEEEEDEFGVFELSFEVDLFAVGVAEAESAEERVRVRVHLLVGSVGHGGPLLEGGAPAFVGGSGWDWPVVGSSRWCK